MRRSWGHHGCAVRAEVRIERDADAHIAGVRTEPCCPSSPLPVEDILELHLG